MSDQEAVVERLKTKLGYTATEAEAVEVAGLMTIVNAAPQLTTILGSEPATVFVPVDATRQVDTDQG